MGLFSRRERGDRGASAWEIPKAGKDPNGVSLSEQYIREMKADWDAGRRRYDTMEGPDLTERGVYGVGRKGEKPTQPHWLGRS